MRFHLSLQLEPEVALDPNLFRQEALKQLKLAPDTEAFVRKTRQSIDARSRQIKVGIEADVFVGETPPSLCELSLTYPDVSRAKTALIVGAGPAGMFAALRLIELGVKPILLERGKDVRARRRDLAAINKDQIVNAESNYCFGEGGAGTYSDGKLYTRSKKRGDIRRILEIFVAHGASEDILVEAHPHIGTNKLPKIVAALRESILQAGGEVHFDTKVTDFVLEKGEIKGVLTAHHEIRADLGVILATGHSARDIFELCQKRHIHIEAKPFAMGVRVEHPQGLIDSVQYHRPDRGLLPAAAYSLVTQTRYRGIERGVFSFCMCPGGFIVPAATANGEVVVNGMSPSRRDSKFANSGIVVAINEPDWKPYQQFGALAGLRFQEQVEQQACAAAGGKQSAPAQRLMDFVKGQTSQQLNPTSYQPGLVSLPMAEILPDVLAVPLREGFTDFGRKMRGFVSNHAQIVGVESRTSSPVRIPRDRDLLEHVQVARLYPCGEGAGYAGGIMSAAMDGERCAEQLVKKYG